MTDNTWKDDVQSDWTDNEIARYRQHHQTGTKARRALELALGTGARRSDLVRLGRENISRGYLSYISEKTGIEVCIPILPVVQAELDRMPETQTLFLETAHGKPHGVNGFGAWFRDRCREAGLDDRCSLHGLRKVCARRLAEAGATPHEIAAVTGHTTLKEVERYTRKTNRGRIHTWTEDEIARFYEVQGLADAAFENFVEGR